MEFSKKHSHPPQPLESIILLLSVIIGVILCVLCNQSEPEPLIMQNIFNNQTREVVQFTFGPISCFQRYLKIKIKVLTEIEKDTNPISFTSSVSLKTSDRFTHTYVQQKEKYTTNKDKPEEVIIFDDQSILSSTCFINLVFDGDLRQFSGYTIECIRGEGKSTLIAFGLSIVLLISSIMLFILFNHRISSFVKGFDLFHPYHLIRILIFLLILSNLPFSLATVIYSADILENVSFLFKALFNSFYGYTIFSIIRKDNSKMQISLLMIIWAIAYTVIDFIYQKKSFEFSNTSPLFNNVIITIIRSVLFGIFVFGVITSIFIHPKTNNDFTENIILYMEAITISGYSLLYLLEIITAVSPNSLIFMFGEIIIKNITVYFHAAVFLPRDDYILTNDTTVQTIGAQPYDDDT